MGGSAAFTASAGGQPLHLSLHNPLRTNASSGSRTHPGETRFRRSRLLLFYDSGRALRRLRSDRSECGRQWGFANIREADITVIDAT